MLARETGRGRKAVPIEAGPPPVLPVHTEAPAHEASPDSTGTGGAPAVAPPVPVVTEAAAHTPPPPAMPPRTMPPAPSPVTEETVPPPAMPGTVTGTGDAPADPVHTALPVAANDAAPSPLIQPIMVGEAPPPERKRGWWKR